MQNKRLAALAVLIAVAVSASVWAAAKKEKKNKKTKIAAAQQMDERQRAVHVLDRFTFGPRPGEVDRVASMGVDKWFEGQLDPQKINDSQLQARLAPLRSLNMNTAELIRNFPPPQVIKAVADGKMALPRDPAERAIYEAQMQRLQDKQEKKQAKAGDGDADPNTPNMADDQKMQLREDRRMARADADRIMSLPPEQRFAAVLNMPPGERDVFVRALSPQQRDDIMNSLTPQQREQVLAMKNPQQVVTTELMQGKILRAAYSERQLQEVMTDFWFNHFNVFIGKGPDRFMITQYENQVIRPRALGKFKDLLLATAQSPAMLFYLDNWQSVGEDSIVGQGGRPNAPRQQGIMGTRIRRNRRFGVGFPGEMPRQQRRRQQQQPRPQQQAKQQQRRGLNENYAREIMELHTLGVDGGYTQKDVTELAKVLTGWTIRDPRQGGDFYFNGRMHEPGPKFVLGHTIKENGEKEGLEMIEILAHSPATAHHISLQIAQRFVSDNPPEALVDRMAKTFVKKDGDIREVLRTMYESPEFWSAETVRAKVKTPLEFVASAIRATGANVNNAMPLIQTLNQMGMPLYGAQPPTGYSMKAETWVNSAALLNRMNFALRLVSGRMPGIEFQPDALLGGIPPADASTAVAQLENALLAGNISKQTHETIMKKMTDPEISERRLDDPVKPVNVGVIAGLILGSPEFQRR